MAGKKRKLTCSICHKTYSSVQGLRRHKLFHSNRQRTRGYRCELCGKYFMSVTYFKKHCSMNGDCQQKKNVIHSKQINKEVRGSQSSDIQPVVGNVKKCGFCQSCFVSSYVLNQHLGLLKPNNLHKCTVCGNGFRCAQLFSDHFITHGNLSKVCYICGDILEVDDSEFRSHLSAHAEVKEFSCYECEKEFCTESELTKHHAKNECREDTKNEAENTGHQEMLIIDKSTTFPDNDILQHVHLDFSTSIVQTQNRIKVEMFNEIESVCRRSTRTPRPTDKKLQHMNSIKKDTDLGCMICSQSFQDRETLNKHILEHTKDSPSNQCQVCSKSFRLRRYLKDHMRTHLKQEPHTCEVCGLKIKFNPSNYHRHLRKHSSKRAFQCKICSRAFYRADDLQVHMRTHEVDRVHSNVCKKCGISFYSSSSLARHEVVHDPNKDVSCDFCEKTFIEKRQYRDHKEKEHGGEEQYRCKFCEKAFCSRYRLEKHNLENHISQLKCSTTDSSNIILVDEIKEETNVEHSSILEDHDDSQSLKCVPNGNLINTEESDTDIMHSPRVDSPGSTPSQVSGSETEEKPDDLDFKLNADVVQPKRKGAESSNDCKEKTYQCSICGKVFVNSGNLGRHLKIHTKSEKETCHICDKTFSCKRYLISHISKVHHNPSRKNSKNTADKAKDLKCLHCDKQFQRKYDLELHSRVHTGIRPFKCDECSASYYSIGNLNRHKEIHNATSNVCHICGKGYACRNYLSTHIRRIHQTEPNSNETFKCDICNKEFTSNSNYKRHLRIHTNVRPYACKICNKKFRRTDDLAIHTKTHTKEKPFQCEVCKKRFNLSHNLKKHQKRHKNIRSEYICDKCGKKFRQQVAFTRHKSLLHGSDNNDQQQISDSVEEPKQLKKKVQELVTTYVNSPGNSSLQHHEARVISQTAAALADAVSSIQTEEIEVETSDKVQSASVQTIQTDLGTNEVVVFLPNPEGPYKCGVCDEIYLEANDLVSHIIGH